MTQGSGSSVASASARSTGSPFRPRAPSLPPRRRQPVEGRTAPSQDDQGEQPEQPDRHAARSRRVASVADGPAQVVAADPHLAPAAVLVTEPAAALRTGPAGGLSAERTRARCLLAFPRRAAAALRGRGPGRRGRSGQVLLLVAEDTELPAVSA